MTNRSTRLWNFRIGVTYAAPRSRVEALCAGLTALLRADAEVVPDSVQVILAGFGASSLDIDVRLYVTTLGLAEYRALQNRLNLQIMDLVARCGCEFAFPSTSVYIEKNGAD